LSDSPRPPRALARLAPLLLFAFAFAIRCLPYRGVLREEGVLFFGGDAWYHMRRIAYGLAEFPRSLGFDPYLNYPEGAVAIWPRFFDSVLSFALLPAYLLGGIGAAERVAAFAPPLLGAASVLACYALGRRLISPRGGLAAAFVLALLSGHFWYTQIGFVDHHAAEALCAALLLLAALRWCEDARPSRALLLGIAEAVALLLWPGTLLHIALIELALFAIWLNAPSAPEFRQLARSRALTHAVACALLLPAAWLHTSTQWGALNPTVLSGFQPWLFASLALHSLLAGFALRSAPGLGQRRATRSALAVGALVLVAAIGVLLLPQLLDAAAEAWRWFGKQERFQSSVAESKALFEVRGEVSARIALLRLSGFALLTPLALGAYLFTARRSPCRKSVLVFALWAGGLLAATLLQKRFFNTSSIAVALLFAWSAFALLERGGAATRSKGLRRGLAVAISVVGLALLWPTLTPYRELLRSGDALPERPDLAAKAELARAGRWLREHSESPSPFHDLASRPSYGFLIHWDLGHLLIYTAQRPQVVGNFGDDLGGKHFELHRSYFRSDEERGLRLLDRVGARYVVVKSLSPQQRAALGPKTLLARLSAAEVAGLQEHRLLYASQRRASNVVGYRIFERVRGVRGRAAPGARVLASYRWKAPTQVEVVHRAESTADRAGNYLLHLPQATATGEAWKIEVDGLEAQIAVEEQALQAGKTLLGPDFSAAGPLGAAQKQ